MKWFLLDASDSSLCIVSETNILQAASNILVGDHVLFHYCGKQYSGTVVMMDSDRDILDSELTRLAKTRKSKKVDESKSTMPSKRKVHPTEFYGMSANDSNKRPALSKVSEAEKTRQRILALNKRAAEERANALLLAKATTSNMNASQRKPESDDEWTPGVEDDQSMDSIIQDKVSYDSNAKKNRYELVKKIRNRIDDEDSHIDVANPRSSGSSPSKAELKKQLELLQKQLKERDAEASPSIKLDKNVVPDKSGNSDLEDLQQEQDLELELKEKDKSFGSSEPPKSTDMNDELGEEGFEPGDNPYDFPSLEHQLYGPREDTKELRNGIYCKTNVIATAITSSHSVTHLCRRLMEGVFNPSEIKNCTVSGQSWNAGGDEHKNVQKEPLHPKALKAIVDFANSVAKKQKWPRMTFDQLKHRFSIKLNEIRKKLKKN